MSLISDKLTGASACIQVISLNQVEVVDVSKGKRDVLLALYMAAQQGPVPVELISLTQ